MDVEILSETR